jgi:acyl dehydratase
LNREDAERVLFSIKERIDQAVEIPIGVMDALSMRRFATVVGDSNPIYHDQKAARKAGYPDIIAHPNYLSAVLVWEPGPPEDELRVDGTVLDETVPSKGFRRMGGGQRLQLISPVVPGDQIRMERRIIKGSLKEAKTGILIIVETEKKYLNQENQVRTICYETLLIR